MFAKECSSETVMINQNTETKADMTFERLFAHSKHGNLPGNKDDWIAFLTPHKNGQFSPNVKCKYWSNQSIISWTPSYKYILRLFVPACREELEQERHASLNMTSRFWKNSRESLCGLISVHLCWTMSPDFAGNLYHQTSIGKRETQNTSNKYDL